MNSRDVCETKTFRDLGADERRHGLRELQDLVAKPDPVTHALLSAFAARSESQSAILAGGVWGGIRWAKGLGRPKTASITEGFSVVHEYRRISLVDEGGGRYKDVGQWMVQTPPSLWDASTDTEFRVGFFFFAGGGGINPNRLSVRLAHVAWQRTPFTRAGTLSLDPFGYGDFGNLGERVVIPDFEVRLHPYSRSPSIRSLGPMRDAAVLRQPAVLPTHGSFD